MNAGRAEVKQVAEWYWAGWALFKKNPAIWVLFTLIWLVLAFVLWLMTPLIGPIAWIAWWVMTPVLYGGYLLAARELEHGRTPVVRHLFQGLLEKDQRGRLLTIGVVTLAALVIVFLVLGAGSQMGAGAVNPDHVRSLAEWLNLFLRALLVAMVSGVSGMSLIYSSPARAVHAYRRHRGGHDELRGLLEQLAGDAGLLRGVHGPGARGGLDLGARFPGGDPGGLLRELPELQVAVRRA